MKIHFTLFLILMSFAVFSQVNRDSTKKTWQFHGNLQVNNNGISPVPAFSLGKPSLMTMFFVNKGKFTFSPEFNYALDGKPWVVNTWLRYQMPVKKIAIRGGINTALFFRRIKVSNAEELRLNQYLALEGAIVYPFLKKNTLQLIYWRSYGLDPTAVKTGNFVSLNASFTKIPLSKSLFVDFRPNLFYIKNQVPYEGFFVSAITNIGYKQSHFNVFMQNVLPIWSKQNAKYSWNFGVNFGF